MGKETKIGWTHHTFNPWWGCTHDGPECDSCYAEAWAKRTGHAVWGHDAPRRFFGNFHWKEPLLWDKAAEKAGERRRVFCASMGDVGERLATPEGERMDAARRELVTLIGRTPWLDWLLLTKRPQNLPTLFPEFGFDGWPRNVWLGTTCGDEAGLQKRAKYLVKMSAPVLFVSYEPALGPANLAPWLDQGISWAIVGGESHQARAKARPFQLDWARSTVEQCRAAGAAPFVKQLGSNAFDDGKPFPTDHPKGEDMAEFPPELQVQQYPKVAA
ncbi:MAG TPA: DUF5131 family protein [Polyangiaceae bacterium]|nr:DUF5131 family protein [Polyangiaceae bacterium]